MIHREIGQSNQHNIISLKNIGEKIHSIPVALPIGFAKLTQKAELALENIEIVLPVFLDIECAFDSASYNLILEYAYA